MPVGLCLYFNPQVLFLLSVVMSTIWPFLPKVGINIFSHTISFPAESFFECWWRVLFKKKKKNCFPPPKPTGTKDLKATVPWPSLISLKRYTSVTSIVKCWGWSRFKTAARNRRSQALGKAEFSQAAQPWRRRHLGPPQERKPNISC